MGTGMGMGTGVGMGRDVGAGGVTVPTVD